MMTFPLATWNTGIQAMDDKDILSMCIHANVPVSQVTHLTEADNMKSFLATSILLTFLNII